MNDYTEIVMLNDDFKAVRANGLRGRIPEVRISGSLGQVSYPEGLMTFQSAAKALVADAIATRTLAIKRMQAEVDKLIDENKELFR